MTRRALMKTGVAAAAFAGMGSIPALLSAQSARENRLAIPPLDPGEMIGGKRVYNLGLQTGTTEFFKGFHTPTMGINGAYLGPVLRMKRGEMVQINVQNGIGTESTLHWHGFNLPAAADGGPHQVIGAGETWSPEFEVREQASTMWYHSHLMGKTAAQVWAGLAGMVIVDDDAQAVDLPSQYGVDDIPVVLQDRRFLLNGTMPYDPNMHDRMAGMQGNYPVINGTISPFVDVTTQRVRLRLLNGSNASIYNLQFRDGRSFQMVASDGGLLTEPASLTALRIAPGERAEIVVDFSDGRPALLESVAGESGGMGGGMGMGGGGMMGGGMMNEQSPVFELLELRPAADLAGSPAVPARLADLAAPDASQAVRTRQFLLEMGMGMRMMMGGSFSINGDEMDMKVINHVVKKDEVEIWEIGNTGPMLHPFHVHNTQFRILDRSGMPPPAHETGLKDTVLVEPGEIVRILVKFEHYTDDKRPYMYHCHILEHEDGGMMGQFTVV
ncbi:MAG TPA: oxidase [Aliiroseovarius sp.]|nr:oxidase [Aliiroseovarius sp.]